jgi:hypothetical protein
VTAPPIIARNLRRIGRNTLVASVDLAVPRWRVTFHGCTWHRQGNKEWINFAGREWIDDRGEKRFAVLVTIDDDRVKDRFQTAALAAVHALAVEAEQR